MTEPTRAADRPTIAVPTGVIQEREEPATILGKGGAGWPWWHLAFGKEPKRQTCSESNKSLDAQGTRLSYAVSNACKLHKK
jgi:hypothetical protein